METAHHRDRRGLERAQRTARLLADRGHEVTFLCAQWWGGDAVPSFEHEGIQYRRVTTEPTSRAFAAKLPAALWRAGADVIHAVQGVPRHVSVTETVATLLRTPVLVDWFGDGSSEPGSERRAAAGADIVTTPSELIRTRVRERGVDDGAVRVVPESIDVELIQEAPVDDRFDVVYARRLDEHANVGTLLLALAERRQRDWSAAIIGDGPEREAVETAARELRIDDRITFTGALSERERASIYKGAHVFAQTASSEPFATALLRALACGCLGVVEYQAGSSAHELVEGRERGRRVTSPEEMARVITEAGAVAHREYNERYESFDHGAVLRTYLDCYEEIRAERGLF
ncbi:glycosyltransferase [Halolamina litorea]